MMINIKYLRSKEIFIENRCLNTLICFIYSLCLTLLQVTERETPI